MSPPGRSGRELTAIVLNWRTPELTVRAARSLVQDGVPPDRVVVVDNGSSDGSGEQFRAELPEVRLLALPVNLGFARANNLGARELPARSAYLFVNSDAFVQARGSVGRLLDAFEDPTAGVAVPRLLNPDLSLQPSVYPLSRPLSELMRASGLSRLLPDRLSPSLGAHWSHRESRPVQAAIGAVLAVRALTWEQLGGFDETRFMFAEDLELFWRLRRRGWQVRFEAGAEFLHLGGASTETAWSAGERAERIARAEAGLLRAELGPARARVTLTAMAAGALGRSVRHRLRGEPGAAEVQRAWSRGYLARP